MSEADAQRVRVLAVADVVRMKSEAEVLKATTAGGGMSFGSPNSR